MERTRNLTRYLIPSIADLILVSVFFALFFTEHSILLLDGDTGYHIRAGEEILRTGSVPHVDPFSQHTPPLPWTAHEWLSETIMAALHRAAGMSGVVALYALILAVTFRLLFRVLRSQRAGVLTATAVTLATLVCSKLHWLARPHLFTFLLLVISHHLLETWRRRGGNGIWLMPPLMLLWANLHGGFAVGFVLLAVYLCASVLEAAGTTAQARQAALKRTRTLLGVNAACLATAVVNPYGWHLLLFPLRLVSDRYLMDQVAEFLPPVVQGWLPFTAYFLLLFALLARSAKVLQPVQLLLLVAFGYLALTSARNVPLFSLVAAPVLAQKLAELSSGKGQGWPGFPRSLSARLGVLERRARGWVFAAIAIATVTGAALGGQVRHGFDPRRMPVAACDFALQRGISGKLFNSDEIGDYLIYRAFPACRVFIDGRLDMYGSHRLREYNDVVSFRPGWDRVLERYGITWIMFETDSRFARFLLQSGAWRRIYADPVATIFQKTAP